MNILCLNYRWKWNRKAFFGYCIPKKQKEYGIMILKKIQELNNKSAIKNNRQ